MQAHNVNFYMLVLTCWLQDTGKGRLPIVTDFRDYCKQPEQGR